MWLFLLWNLGLSDLRNKTTERLTCKVPEDNLGVSDGVDLCAFGPLSLAAKGSYFLYTIFPPYNSNLFRIRWYFIATYYILPHIEANDWSLFLDIVGSFSFPRLPISCFLRLSTLAEAPVCETAVALDLVEVTLSDLVKVFRSFFEDSPMVVVESFLVGDTARVVVVERWDRLFSDSATDFVDPFSPTGLFQDGLSAEIVFSSPLGFRLPFGCRFEKRKYYFKGSDTFLGLTVVAISFFWALRATSSMVLQLRVERLKGLVSIQKIW